VLVSVWLYAFGPSNDAALKKGGSQEEAASQMQKRNVRSPFFDNTSIEDRLQVIDPWSIAMALELVCIIHF